MKRHFLPLLAIVALAACNPSHEEVVLQFPNGDPELVYIVKGKEEQRKVIGEKMFYGFKQLTAVRLPQQLTRIRAQWLPS